MSDIDFKNEKLTKWDTADFINDREDVCYFLGAVLEEGYADTLPMALNDVFRSKGMKDAASELGTTIDAIGQEIGKDTAQPFEAICRLLDILGYKLYVMPKSA